MSARTRAFLRRLFLAVLLAATAAFAAGEGSAAPQPGDGPGSSAQPPGGGSVPSGGLPQRRLP